MPEEDPVGGAAPLLEAVAVVVVAELEGSAAACMQCDHCRVRYGGLCRRTSPGTVADGGRLAGGGYPRTLWYAVEPPC